VSRAPVFEAMAVGGAVLGCFGRAGSA
jgi:hypothetical protein